MTAFATVLELESFWKQLVTQSDKDRAETLLDAASNYLRLVSRNNGTNLDTRIAEDTAEDPDAVLGSSVKLVVMSAVKRAMSTPADAPPADQWSQSASPYSETIKFSDPSSDIFFKKNELTLIGVGSLSGKSKVGILRGVRG